MVRITNEAAQADVSGPQSITHRRVVKIAAPIVISNATVPILGAVDTGVVGQMGLAAPIGAVGLGAGQAEAPGDPTEGFTRTEEVGGSAAMANVLALDGLAFSDEIGHELDEILVHSLEKGVRG